MKYNDMVENWKRFAVAIENLGGEVQSLFVDEPATEKEIAR